jgi:hypothetical protein
MNMQTFPSFKDTAMVTNGWHLRTVTINPNRTLINKTTSGCSQTPAKLGNFHSLFVRTIEKLNLTAWQYYSSHMT